MKAVIFDMDGVLVDSEPLWQQAVLNAFHPIGVRLTHEQVQEISGMRVDAVVDYWHQRYPWDGPPQKAVEGIILDGVVQLIQAHGQEKEGALAILDFFRDQGVPLALASSSPVAVIEAVMHKLHIGHYFDVVYSAEFEPYGKPHPGVYITAARKLGVTPQDCLVFEDSLPGLLSAKSAQMTCVCVPAPSLIDDKRLGIADTILSSLAAFEPAMWFKFANGSK